MTMVITVFCTMKREVGKGKMSLFYRIIWNCLELSFCILGRGLSTICEMTYCQIFYYEKSSKFSNVHSISILWMQCIALVSSLLSYSILISYCACLYACMVCLHLKPLISPLQNCSGLMETIISKRLKVRITKGYINSRHYLPKASVLSKWLNNPLIIFSNIKNFFATTVQQCWKITIDSKKSDMNSITLM